MCKGIPVLTLPLQSCARTYYLEILFGIMFTKFMAYFGKEISDFRFVVERFSHMEI